MPHDSAPLTPDDFFVPDFTPVPMLRTRHDGWTGARQRGFLMALEATGSAAAAAKMVGMSRKSAYALRARGGAESFAAAWDSAISAGRARMFDYLFDRAINGVTTITLKMGGAVEIGHGRDRQLVAAQFKSPLPGENRFAERAGQGRATGAEGMVA